MRIAERAGPQVVLPTDELTFAVARARDAFTGASVPLATHELLDLADHKTRLLAHATRMHIPVPHSYEVESPDLAKSEGPFIVKLPNSRGSRGVWRVESAAEAQRLARELSTTRPPALAPMVQERVPGIGWGVSRLYWEGEKIAGFTHVRLREKLPIGGTSTLRASASAPLLEEAADALLASLGWHGLANVEFRFDQASERFWLMEVNPRVWGSIALPVHCGVDFPWLLYLCALGRVSEARDASPAAYPLGVRARWLAGEVAQAASFLRAGDWGQLGKVIGSRADHTDDLRWDDPLAFAGEMAYYANTRGDRR